MLKLAQYVLVGLFGGVAAASFVVAVVSFFTFLMETFGPGVGGWVMLCIIFSVLRIFLATIGLGDEK